MKLLCSLILCYAVFLTQLCSLDAQRTCEYLERYSGCISFSSDKRRMQNFKKCWYIEPPEESIIRVNIAKLDLNDPYCDNVYIEMSDYTGRREKVCQRYSYNRDWTNKTLTMVGAVNITLNLKYSWDYVYFYIEYEAESIVCASKDHFRCSSYQCIRSEKVCDGVEDCANGLDESECGVSAINGTRESRLKAINWLFDREKNYGWGRNTHRAVTSLYLTEAAKFRGKNVSEEIIVKQLQLKMAASLLRNLTEPLSVNELSMYVNALLVTCHNVRNILSEDLLRTLADRAFSSSPTSPGAYLTLCNANWPFLETNVDQLLNILTRNIEYPFALEMKAMTIMALSCLIQKTSVSHNMYNTSFIYNETIQNFMANQKEDGSFGNAHTTAMVTQALVSSGQSENSQWNLKNAMDFLMNNLNSTSADFLTVYLTLPLFKGKTLVDIGSVRCSGYQRKLEDDDDILDVTDRLGEKVHVQYSLYFGDNKNVIHNIYLKVPENSTVYEVMKMAQIADSKYKFTYHETNGHLYIYELAGLTNDIEAGKFWFFYKTSDNNTEPKQFTQSPDQVIVRDREHFIMWYKSSNIY